MWLPEVRTSTPASSSSSAPSGSMPLPPEVLEPLDVALEHLAPRPGTGPGERVGGVDERRQDGLRAHLLVVGRDGVHDLRRLAVLAGDLAADDRVRSFHLVGERLADVVQQRGAARLLLVETELGRA